MNPAPRTPRQLGIIGGMSWASSLTYYRIINEAYAAARGGQHSAPMLLASIDFQPIVKAQSLGDWHQAGHILADAAQSLERGGADAFMIASNTMHLVAGQVAAAVSIPLLNIFDATAQAIKKAGLSRIGLLGTRYTMSHPFFLDQFARRGIEVVVPAERDAVKVNDIIFKELIKNTVTPASKRYFQEIIHKLSAAGAEGAVLGCTEIGLLIGAGDADVPIFDTAAVHAAMGVHWLLQP